MGALDNSHGEGWHGPFLTKKECFEFRDVVRSVMES